MAWLNAGRTSKILWEGKIQQTRQILFTFMYALQSLSLIKYSRRKYELWPCDIFQARQERQRHMQMYPHWNARLVSLLSFWKIWRRIVAYTDITNIKYCLLSISHWATIFRRDNYRYGQKKKKRKRDKTDDPGITDWQCDWVSSLIHIYGFC